MLAALVDQWIMTGPRREPVIGSDSWGEGIHRDAAATTEEWATWRSPAVARCCET
jgi:hypothetical protein